MRATIGATLASAVGVAISAVPFIAVILMLFSGAATRNSLFVILGARVLGDGKTVVAS